MKQEKFSGLIIQRNNQCETKTTSGVCLSDIIISCLCCYLSVILLLCLCDLYVCVCVFFPTSFMVRKRPRHICNQAGRQSIPSKPALFEWVCPHIFSNLLLTMICTDFQHENLQKHFGDSGTCFLNPQRGITWSV